MNKVYKYSIIRFQPLPYTGEFANIGILIFDETDKKLDYRLARKRFARLKDFFGEQAYFSYAAAIDHLRMELTNLIDGDGFRSMREPGKTFDYLTRQNESALIFSETRRLVSAESLDVVIDDLFSVLVMRQRQDSHDLSLVREIRQRLVARGIRGFKTIRLEDPIVPITLPLANNIADIKAIHPVVFSQKTPLGVFDHGVLWKKRLQYHLENNNLAEKSVLIAIDDMGDEIGGSMRGAVSEAISEISSLPFDVVTTSNNQNFERKIFDFAEKVNFIGRNLFH